MNTLAVHSGFEMAKGVNQLLLRPPVELRAPVLRQFFQIIEICPVIPTRPRNLTGPASGLKTAAQVEQYSIIDFDLEWCDVHASVSFVAYRLLQAVADSRP